MSHADTLRDMAKAFMMAGSCERVDTCLAGADALDAVERVRHALSVIARVKADYSEAASDRDDDNAEWHETTADALEYVIDLIAEALEGEAE